MTGLIDGGMGPRRGVTRNDSDVTSIGFASRPVGRALRALFALLRCAWALSRESWQSWHRLRAQARAREGQGCVGFVGFVPFRANAAHAAIPHARTRGAGESLLSLLSHARVRDVRAKAAAPRE